MTTKTQTKNDLINELVSNVSALWRRDAIDYYEVNQAEHIRCEFQLSGDLTGDKKAFVANRAKNEVGRFPKSLATAYRDFRDRWERLETKEKKGATR